MSIRITNATNTCQICLTVDLTCELRRSTKFRLPVPICNPCWPKERRNLARARERRQEQARALAAAREGAGAQPA